MWFSGTNHHRYLLSYYHVALTMIGPNPTAVAGSPAIGLFLVAVSIHTLLSGINALILVGANGPVMDQPNYASIFVRAQVTCES